MADKTPQADGSRGTSELVLTPLHHLFILALKPLWNNPSFTLDLAWLLSKPSYHRMCQDDNSHTHSHTHPSPSWLSSLDFLEKAHIITSCVDHNTLSFQQHLSSFLAPAVLDTAGHIQVIEEGWSLYLTYWARQTSLVNSQLNTCDSQEALAYYRQHEKHFTALFDFLLQYTITDEEVVEGAPCDVWSPMVLVRLIHRLSYLLGGHLEHLCAWMLAPVHSLALCRCVSQALDPYTPLDAYHPALDNMTGDSDSDDDDSDDGGGDGDGDDDGDSSDGGVCGDEVGSKEIIHDTDTPSPSDLPPYVAVPSRAYLSARLELAVQLRVHGQYQECYDVLNNTGICCSVLFCVVQLVLVICF
jgi:hypothetical protein